MKESGKNKVMSYSWLRENSKENMPVTQGDLQNLEDYADRLFSRVGIDVAFTRHFLDRVNDERNQKQITIGELIRIFKQEYKYYGKKIAQLGPDAEAVMKDMKTDVNIPFALHWDSNNNELDLVAKTVMRKKDFKTSNPEFAVADVQPDEDKVGPNIFENLAPNSEIYVDMDGVLADFFGEWAKLMGVNSWKQISNIDVALDKVREQDDFWVNLPMTSNAKTLLSAIKKAKGKYNILSAPLPDDPNSVPGKQEWIKKNLASFPPEKVILDHDKAKYAKQSDGTPNALIDDYGENIKKWEAAGGIGIKHENNTVQSTVNKLDREVEPMTEEDFLAQFTRYVDRKSHSGMYSRAADAFHKWLKSEDKPYRHSLNFYAMEFARRYLKVDWRNLAKAYTDEYGDQAIVKEDLVEAWSKQYKDSIDCSNPKGFSQKAHCAGRKKTEGAEITMWTNPEYQGSDVDDEYYNKQPAKLIDVSKLTPFEPADKMDDKISAANMGKLVTAIQAGEKINPIVVVPHKGKLLIVDGHHRYFATIKAGVDKIRAVMADPKDLTWRDDVPIDEAYEINGSLVEDPRAVGKALANIKYGKEIADAILKGTDIGILKAKATAYLSSIDDTLELLNQMYPSQYNKNESVVAERMIEENLDNCKYGKYYCSTDKKWKCRKGPKQTREEYNFVREGVGIITKQNTTVDVKPGETQRQAKKLGMYIDSKGSPPLLHKKAAKNSDPNTLSNLGIGK